jgi:hypothetical protein
MKNDEKKKNLLKKFAERLRDPLQFRIFITVVMLAVGYLGIVMPLGDRIAQTATVLKKAKEHQTLVKEIKALEAQVNRVVARLPKNSDTNEWVQYVLAGVRKLPVRLLNLGSDDPRRVGPFEAVVLRVALRGNYKDLESFLAWVETNERLFRIDGVTIAPARGSDKLDMDMTLLGLRG